MTNIKILVMTLLEKAFQVGAKRNCKLNYHLKEQCCLMRPWLATMLQCEFKSTNLVRIIKFQMSKNSSEEFRLATDIFILDSYVVIFFSDKWTA